MNTSEEIKKRYNRISGIYEMMDRMIKEKWRVDLLSQVSGKVLEVGIGTGVNLQYYPNQITSLTGIDFSRGMLEHAKDKVISGDFEFPIELREADIQDLPFPDNSFDSIVSTCVFCSVPDPIKGLMEIRRVCKPTGQIYMLEHMRSDKELIGLVMDVLNPLTVKLWGANINRDTIGNIERADLKIDKHILLMSSIFRELTLSPDKKIIETP
ncbi:class I SAM-dependent methyltransferase [Robertmurraya yapensis]|uniref:Class I SAM-dependent methyltransferase n=1 Tax=Bacillus yapensis TaxID=2492960 RepID=A0A3S0RGY3_9BACI|nr:class I SAM-dependent methyltransferase [Bacillus yapensis]RTR28145.1 class I SAM-dependent methyltransferase [Bacillus yapensis]TKS94388.1 methyltransferase domain-containing protein [Bacillus yapensis]